MALSIFAGSLAGHSDLASIVAATLAAFTCGLLVAVGPAAAFVALRGHGEAVTSDPDARRVHRLSHAARSLPPRAIYCRPADAKPMASAALASPC